jgi:hypothetical protein
MQAWFSFELGEIALVPAITRSDNIVATPAADTAIKRLRFIVYLRSFIAETVLD